MPDGVSGTTDGQGGLFGGHAGKEAHLDQLGEIRRFAGEIVEGGINRKQIVRGRSPSGEPQGGIEGDGTPAAAAFGATLGAGVVQEYLPHGSRSDGEEMDAVRIGGGFSGEEFQVRFVHQGVHFERVIRTRAAEVSGGDPFELRVDERHEFVERLALSFTPSVQQNGDSRQSCH